MAMKWTTQQQSVIDNRNQNLLVSAAAGSGKTAVLVERIIKRITDASAPVDIDRLLIVTFTNAAAAEMRQRISEALDQLREENPKDERLERQQTLIHNAMITTIDSFCLYVIRNYFDKISLDPNFRVADEAEIRLLEADVLQEVFEEYYEKEDNETFLQWVDAYSDTRSDAKAKEMILRIYRQSESSPWPKEWIENLVENYRVSGEKELEQTEGIREIVESTRVFLKDMKERIQNLLEIAISEEELVPYTVTLKEDLTLLESAEEKKKYDDLYNFFENLTFSSLKPIRDYDGDITKKNTIQEARNEIKKQIAKHKQSFFHDKMEDHLKQLKRMCPVVELMVQVALTFSDRVAQKKMEKRIVDFSDMEHWALQILVDKKTKECTETALTFRAHFDEVMIDEYQDSNQVQEAIMQAISGQEEGERKLFLVGDVKQSIYRFRLARPELFMEKYKNFGTSQEEANRRINLHKNFRSRKEVLDFTNDVFKKIMQPDLGNVAYDKEAALYLGADYPPSGEMKPEILIFERKDREEAEEPLVQREDSKRMEARMIAQKMLSMKRYLKVTEKDGTMRPVQWSDMVILLRNLKEWDLVFQEVLEEYGIPVVVESSTGYFSAIEVQTVLAYLKILDNPLQDIPMAAVLRSPIVGLTEEDLAQIRVERKEGSFAKAVLEAMEEATEGPLAMFAKQYQKLRAAVCDTPIHEMIQRILKESGYGDYAAAMPAGDRRTANLEMLVEKAIAYENTSYKGLFHFLRYVEQLKKYDVDYGEAGCATEGQNAVSIMTIHRSKGLEFPVVFVSGIGKKFNKTDSNNKMVLHPDLGIGMVERLQNPKREQPCILKRILVERIEKESLGEELRILYVALTRAKEKLILTASVTDYETLIQKCPGMRKENLPLSYLQRILANSYLEWVLAALQSYPGKYHVECLHAQDLLWNQAGVHAKEELSYRELLEMIAQVDENKVKQLKEELDLPYRYEKDINRKNKYSVSELKHDSMLERYDALQGEAQRTYGEIPEWSSSSDSLPSRGALRGTALHRVMECLDFAAILKLDPTKEQDVTAFVQEQLDGMKEKEQITEELYELVLPSMIIPFVSNEIAYRMAKADAEGKLYREKAFVMEKDGVLIQGIIDVFWFEGDQIVLLDYKSDRVETKEELILRYQTQLELYGEAINRVFSGGEKEQKVRECLIYSFRLKEVIQL